MKNKKQIISGIAAIVFAVVFAMIPPFEGLTQHSMVFMGVLISTLFLTVTGAFADWLIFLTSLVVLVLTGVTDVTSGFSMFSSGTVWNLIMIFALSASISKSGILKRLSYKVLSLFPPNYSGAVFSILTAGVALSPLLPSTTMKVNIMMSATNELCEVLGIEPRSRGAKGLFAITFIPIYIGGQVFTTGTAAFPIMVGLMGMADHFDMISWFVAASVWYFVLLAGVVIYSVIFCKPKNAQKFSKDFFKEKAKEFGPLTYTEKAVSIILVLAFILWGTTSITGLDSNMITVLVVILLILSNVLPVEEFTSAVPWTLIIFVGCMLSIPNIMSSVGWNEWIATNLGFVVAPVISSPWIFIPFLIIFTVLLRFVLIDPTATLILLVAVFLPFLEPAGISPFIMVFICYVAASVFFVPYQCSVYLGAIKLMDRITFKEARQVSFVYVCICIIGALASIPLWYALGYLV